MTLQSTPSAAVPSGIYPWQNDVWRLLNINKQSRAHALLLHGRVGIGKYDFARHLSQSLLCRSADEHGHGCGVCSSCHWFNEESHPDFRKLSPGQAPDADEEGVSVKKTKKKTHISVEQVRELSDFLSMSSHLAGGARVVLIHPSEALNLASANALLKTLEEPADGVVFILVAHHLQRLLPTIISRCQKIHMPTPDDALALEWLQAQGVDNAVAQLAYWDGSPIRVLNEQVQFGQMKDIWRLLAQGRSLQANAAAASFIGDSVEMGLIALQKWIYDIVALKITHNVHYHPLYKEPLQALANQAHLKDLFQLQKKIDELRKLALHPLNHDVQMESVLLEYKNIF